MSTREAGSEDVAISGDDVRRQTAEAVNIPLLWAYMGLVVLGGLGLMLALMLVLGSTTS